MHLYLHKLEKPPLTCLCFSKPHTSLTVTNNTPKMNAIGKKVFITNKENVAIYLICLTIKSMVQRFTVYLDHWSTFIYSRFELFFDYINICYTNLFLIRSLLSVISFMVCEHRWSSQVDFNEAIECHEGSYSRHKVKENQII